MDDLISRQAVKDWLLRWEGYIDKDIIARMQYRVIDIPSAQQWIPCDEGVPEETSDWKNVTVVDESGDTAYRYSSIGWYLGDGMWIVDNEPMEESSSIRVVAWMPLPEPYVERREE